MANAGEKRKLSIEPITAVCAVILLIACVTVISVDVYGKYIDTSETTINYGDTVTVDYVGSLYTYYTDSDGNVKAVIFDTTLESVGKNSDYLFTSSFNKTSYSTASVNIGEGKYLKDFENALIGAKVGETIKVKIEAGKGYTGPDNYKYAEEFSFSNSFVMTTTAFNTFYGQSLNVDGIINFTDKNGFHITADKCGSDVTVTYNVSSSDEAYTVSDSALGKVKVQITDVTGDTVKYTISVENALKTGKQVTADGHTVDGIEVLSFTAFPNEPVNIYGFDGSKIVYTKAVADSSGVDPLLYNQDIYFVIKVVSKS